MIRNSIFVFVMFFCVTSCQDILEVNPESAYKEENFYSNESEIELALAGIYGKLADDDLYGWQFNVLLEGGTDESYTNDPTGWAESKYEHTASSSAILSAWLTFYNCIHMTNQFVERVSPSIFENPEDYSRAIAKAMFYRAFCYSNLANWFGPVPLRLAPSVDQRDNNLAASPVYDVYKQAEADFQYAVAYLVDTQSADYVPGEPNKMAAHGLLARLYLKMGGYQPDLGNGTSDHYFEDNQQYFPLALAHCDTIISSGQHGIVPFSTDPKSYRNHFINYLQDRYDLQESLFEISFGNFRDVGIIADGRIGNINGVEFSGTLDIPRGFCKINASLPLYNIYQSNAADVRAEWNIAGFRNRFNNALNGYTMSYVYDFPLNQEYGPGKFRRWEPTDLAELKNKNTIFEADYEILNNTVGSATDGNFTSINFPILRYSDVLLMYAEASIGGRFGSAAMTAQGEFYLNIVRERAGLAPYAGGTAHAEFFDEIVDERFRELCFEGLRKQDLIRWDLLEDKLNETNEQIRSYAGYSVSNQFHQTYLAPGENFDRNIHMLLPYPIQEIQINTKLQQRIGW